MPRAFDLQIPKADKDPLANLLDFSNIDQAAALAGNQIRAYLDSLLDGVVNVIEDLTGLDLQQLSDLLRSFDLSSPEAFVASVINFLITLPDVLLSLLDQLLAMLVTLPEQLTNLLTGLLEQLTAATGVDLTVFLPLIQDLDFTDPISFFVSLGEALLTVGSSLLGIDSPLNALNLFNLVPTDLLAHIPASNIGHLPGQSGRRSVLPECGRVHRSGYLVPRRHHRPRRIGCAQHHRQRHPEGAAGQPDPGFRGPGAGFSGWAKWTGLAASVTRSRWRSPATTRRALGESDHHREPQHHTTDHRLDAAGRIIHRPGRGHVDPHPVVGRRHGHRGHVVVR